MTCYMCGRPTDQIIDGNSQCDDCRWFEAKLIGVVLLIIIVGIAIWKLL